MGKNVSYLTKIEKLFLGLVTKKVQNDLQGCKDERFLVILDSASTGFGMC